MEEIWRDIPDYEGLYQVSNLGRVRSLPRQWITGKNTLLKHNGKILKLCPDTYGYLTTRLTKNSITKTKTAHKLVAMAFLGHKPNGYIKVVDHINDIRTDNRVENLQIVTQRFNARKTQGNYSSQYKGVHLRKDKNKWQSRIIINNKRIHLGLFENEYDAHLAYQNALKNLEQ